jgi:hypothetical protein
MSLTKNLRNVANMASPEHWTEGKNWYRNARLFCYNFAVTYNLPLERVVGMLAALSPQTAWSINKTALENLLSLDECPGYTGYKVNINKARRIFHGEDALTVLGQGTRYGAKVRAFYDNILNPGTSELVTIDTHAIRAAYDIADVPRDLIRAVFESKLNLEIQAAYVKVSKEFNVRPCEFQAVCWLVVKDNL